MSDNAVRWKVSDFITIQEEGWIDVFAYTKEIVQENHIKVDPTWRCNLT